MPVVNPISPKFIATRVYEIVSAATITPEVNLYDVINITSAAENFTIANPTGTAVSFQKLMIRLKDNGVPRLITFGSKYAQMGVALPTITTLSKKITLGFVYDINADLWGLIALSTEI